MKCPKCKVGNLYQEQITVNGEVVLEVRCDNARCVYMKLVYSGDI